MASFDPYSSTSHPPLSSATAPSMADQLPSINFRVEDLRSRVAQFSQKFDAFIERGRKQVLEERNRFYIDMVELQGKISWIQRDATLQLTQFPAFFLEDQRMKEKDIEILNLKLQTHAQMLQKENIEATEIHVAITQISQQRDHRLALRDRLRQQISETQRSINQRLEAQRVYAKQLDTQAGLNIPELDFWQDLLCLRIEGAGRDDRLKIIFTHLSEKDWEREAWFELGTATYDYEVFHCRPKLDKNAIEEVQLLNEDRDFGAFLKRMRRLFVAALK
ncbi:kinetochore-associated Ndc80 complex subunit spc25 [Myotisia sp. PD_48]|nr:kinetochore-associated Ndc80 complex subunit spc25 [Myotisia sp. PD_48]